MFRICAKSSFLIGFVIGVILAVLVKVNTRTKLEERPPVKQLSRIHYDKWFDSLKLKRRQISFDSLRYGNGTYYLESDYLHKEVSVLCLILVRNSKNANAIANTWGRHCNKLQLVSLKPDKQKIVIRRNSKDSSWVILCEALKQVPESFKWIIVVYDFTFVLVENLRLFLAGLNHKEKYYLGHPVKFWNVIYNMGQAGYVLSKHSVDLFKKEFKENDSCTKLITYRNQEDFYLGKSLVKMNITPIDTTDQHGFSTFHPYNLYHVYFPGDNSNKFSIYPHKCCSRQTIAFQAIEGDKMYTYYYLLYTVQLFNLGHNGNKPPMNPFRDDEVWKKFLRERNFSENVSPAQYYKIWENLVDDPTSFAKNMKREEYFDYTQ